MLFFLALSFELNLLFMSPASLTEEVLSLFLPDGTLNYFEITSFLKILHRRWRYKNRSGSFSRNWDFIAGGMRISKDFAAFLKELPG